MLFRKKNPSSIISVHVLKCIEPVRVTFISHGLCISIYLPAVAPLQRRTLPPSKTITLPLPSLEAEKTGLQPLISNDIIPMPYPAGFYFIGRLITTCCLTRRSSIETLKEMLQNLTVEATALAAAYRDIIATRCLTCAWTIFKTLSPLC